MRYVLNNDVQLHKYTNFDKARSADGKKSTSGVCFTLGSAMISWMSRKQKSVALNIAKAEYIATNEACNKALWLWKLLAGLLDWELETRMICCDNQSRVKLSQNLVFHDRTKHVEIKYHYICDMVQKRVGGLEYISIDEQTT